MTPPSAAPSLVLREGAVSWTPVDDGQIVVLDMRTSRYLSLNATGAALWTRLVDGATRDDLVTLVVDSYGVAAAQAEADVDAFLTALRGRDLLDE